MDLTLTRTEFRPDGVFGRLESADGGFSCVTLEHSYSGLPKLPDGEYSCLRGTHRLTSMDHDFETFEILNVPGHSNILLHTGNYDQDSEGCVLLGEQIIEQTNGEWWISSSRAAFARFIAAQAGCDSFTLTVRSEK